MQYEAGWGKKMEYVLAGNTTGVADVTLRYTGKWKEVSVLHTQTHTHTHTHTHRLCVVSPRVVCALSVCVCVCSQVLARRTLMTEQQLAALVQARNTQLRALLAPAALHECAKQDLSEERVRVCMYRPR